MAWWTFDGKQVSGVHVYDASGNGNRGTMTNEPTRTIGKIGQGMQFDGFNDSVAMGTTANLAIASGGISMSAWIYPTRADGYIFGRSWNNTSYGNYSLYLTGSLLAFAFTGASSPPDHAYFSANTLSLNTWHHVAVSYTYGTGSSLKMYIDGTFVSGSWNVGNGNEAYNASCNCGFEVGHWHGTAPGASNAYWFAGKIDDAKVYNHVLNADEIKRLYNMGR